MRSSSRSSRLESAIRIWGAGLYLMALLVSRCPLIPGSWDMRVCVTCSCCQHTDQARSSRTFRYPANMWLGAGYVKATGSNISNARPGDAVLLSFAFCTECHNCTFGAPGYCERFAELNITGNARAFKDQNDKSIGGSFFGQSSFSRLTRVQSTSVVNVTGLVDDEAELRLFVPMGCGIQVCSCLWLMHRWVEKQKKRVSGNAHLDRCRDDHRACSCDSER